MPSLTHYAASRLHWVLQALGKSASVQLLSHRAPSAVAFPTSSASTATLHRQPPPSSSQAITAASLASLSVSTAPPQSVMEQATRSMDSDASSVLSSPSLSLSVSPSRSRGGTLSTVCMPCLSLPCLAVHVAVGQASVLVDYIGWCLWCYVCLCNAADRRLALGDGSSHRGTLCTACGTAKEQLIVAGVGCRC